VLNLRRSLFVGSRAAELAASPAMSASCGLSVATPDHILGLGGSLLEPIGRGQRRPMGQLDPLKVCLLRTQLTASDLLCLSEAFPVLECLLLVSKEEAFHP